MDIAIRKTPDPLGDRLRGGRDPAGHDLPGVGVKRVEGDLGAMDVKARVYDAHEGPPLAPEENTVGGSTPA